MDVSPANKLLAPWRELFGHRGADGVLVAYDVTLRARRGGGDVRQTFYSVLNPKACVRSPKLGCYLSTLGPQKARCQLNTLSLFADTRTNQDASPKPSDLGRWALQARYGSRTFRPNLEGPSPYEHEGRGPTTYLSEMFLLLRCFESANVRKTLNVFALVHSYSGQEMHESCLCFWVLTHGAARLTYQGAGIEV